MQLILSKSILSWLNSGSKSKILSHNCEANPMSPIHTRWIMRVLEKSWLRKISNWQMLWANLMKKTMSFCRLMADSSHSKLSWLKRIITFQLCKKKYKNSTWQHLTGNISLTTLTEMQFLFAQKLSESKVSRAKFWSKITLYFQICRLLKCISKESTKKKTNSKLSCPKWSRSMTL